MERFEQAIWYGSLWSTLFVSARPLTGDGSRRRLRGWVILLTWWEVMKHNGAISKAWATRVSRNKIAKLMFFPGSLFSSTDTLLTCQLDQAFSQKVDFLPNSSSSGNAFKKRCRYKNNSKNVDYLWDTPHGAPSFYGLRIHCQSPFISYDSVIEVYLSWDCTTISLFFITVSQHLTQCLAHDRPSTNIHSVTGILLLVVFYSVQHCQRFRLVKR